jgi:periplasmic protein TonB
MASMSGAAGPMAPLRRPPPPDDDKEPLFSSLIASNPTPWRFWSGAKYSLPVHLVILALIVLLPVFWPEASPDHPDFIKALIYNPPPPPPPPLPKGSSLLQKPMERAQPVTPDTKPEEKFTAPQDKPTDDPIKPENKLPADQQVGSETGSENGVPEGMESGVDGGVVGGVPGGVLGGVIGGTGDGPVMDWDQAPRLIKQVKPIYPQDAFVKKIEGTVVLEALIDVTGAVSRTRVVQSVPALDAAALQTVHQWRFSPAMKHGRAVATLVRIPVSFRIF